MQHSTQAVILVDINAISNSEKIDDSEFEKTLAALRLGTLKLLTYFSHSQIRSDERVKWGHKFYNSLSVRSLANKHSFQEMRIDSFEEFENEVVVHLTKERERLRKLEDLKSEFNLANDDGASHENSNATTHRTSHCDSLKNALKEILCDFQWDRPDITSPVRKSKRRTRLKTELGDGERDNLLFIISECPWTTEELLVFLGSSSGTMNLNTNFVLNSIMTSNMLSVYCSSLKLRVFWLDTTCLYSPSLSPKEETSGYDLVDETLDRLGGTVIPVSSLVQLSSCHTFPTTSVISWYLGSSRKGTLNAQLMQKDKDKAVICEFEIAPVESKTMPFDKPSCQHTHQWNVFVEGLVPRCFLPMDVQLTSVLLVPVKAKKVEFFCLLQLLMSHKMSMVVNCSGNTGILSPLTATLAILEIINCHPRGLAKLASDCCHSKELSQEQLLEKKRAKLQCFIQSSITQVVKNQASRNNSHCSNSVYCDAPVRRQFSGHVMDKWFCNTRIHASSPDSIKENNTYRKEQEAIIMYKVRRRLGPNSSICDNVIVSQSEVNKGNAKQSSKMNVSARATQLVSYSQAKQLRRQERQLKAKLQSSNNVTFSEAVDTKPKEKQLLWMRLFHDFELSDENNFSTRLKRVYQDLLDNGMPVLACAENIVSIAMHYTRSSSKPNIEKSSKELLESELFKSPTAVNETYETFTKAGTKDDKIREYELQSLLRLETLAVVPNQCDQEKLISEAAAHLRNISFVADPAHLGEFLRDVIYNNYISSLPDVVKEIFDELNQPLPHADGSDCSESSRNGNKIPFSLSELDGCLSDSNTADTSSVSSPVGYNKRKSLQRCQSFSEVSQKRQIVVPVKNRVSTRTQKSRKSRTHSSPQLSTGLVVDQTTDMKKVCRNLFQRGFLSPVKNVVPESIEIDERKKKRVLKTKEAPNTPFHKQVANAHLQKQARLRKNTKSLTSLTSEIVEESPIKKVEATCIFPNNDMNSQLPFYPPATVESRNVNRLKLHFRNKSENTPSNELPYFISPEKPIQNNRLQLKSQTITSSQVSVALHSSIPRSQQNVSLTEKDSKNECSEVTTVIQDTSSKHFVSIASEELHRIPPSYDSNLTRVAQVVSPVALSPSTRVTRSQSIHGGKVQYSLPLTNQRTCKHASRNTTSLDALPNDNFSDPNCPTSQESTGEQRVPSDIDLSLSPELFPNPSAQHTRLARCRKKASLPDNMVAVQPLSKRSRKSLLFSLNTVGVDNVNTHSLNSSAGASGEQVVPLLDTKYVASSCSKKFSQCTDRHGTVDAPSYHPEHNFKQDTAFLTNFTANFMPNMSVSNLKAVNPTGFVKQCCNDNSVIIPLSPSSSNCATTKTDSNNSTNAVCCKNLSSKNLSTIGSGPETICSDDHAVSNHDCNKNNSVVESSPTLLGIASPEPLTFATLSALNDLFGSSIQDVSQTSSRGSPKSLSSSFQSEMSIQFTECSERTPVLNSTATTANSSTTCNNKQYCNDHNTANSSPQNKTNKLFTQLNNEKLTVKPRSLSPLTFYSGTIDCNSILSSKFPLVRLERFNVESHYKNSEQHLSEIKSSLHHWRKTSTGKRTRTSSRTDAKLQETSLLACAFQADSSIYVSPSRSASATPSKSDTPRTLLRKRHFSTGEIYDKTETNTAFDFEHIPIQRLTRHQSKEIGISAEEFKTICTKTPEKISKLVRNLDQGQMPIKRPCLELRYSGDSEDEVFFSESKFQKDSTLATTKLTSRLRTRQGCVS